MVHVTITGAGGFLGRRLAREIVARGVLSNTSGRLESVTRLDLVDVVEFAAPAAPGIDVRVVTGDLSDKRFVDALGTSGFDSLFHLASYLTYQSEEEPDQAYAVNVSALRTLLESAGVRRRVVFTSSIAVFGQDAPKAAGDRDLPCPDTSYGTHKAVVELLVADASRRGLVDGRSLRLPIILTRPGGKPQPIVADQIAALVRQPLDGVDAVAPLAEETVLPLASAGAVVSALLDLHEIPAADVPPGRVMNLPSLSITIGELVAAVRRAGATGQTVFQPNERLQRITDGWPRALVSETAAQLGIAADADVGALIADYLEHKEH